MNHSLLDKLCVKKKNLEAFRQQMELCQEFGSCFTARILRCFSEVATHDSAIGNAVLSWSGNSDALNDAIPLRVSAAFHALSRSGRCPELTTIYPPNPAPCEDKLKSALQSAITSNDNWLLEWTRKPPQTNEVGRSACLYLGLMAVVGRFGLPLRVFEIGSSAGLNLNLDLYSYDFAGGIFGAVDSPLRITPTWIGNAPTGQPPKIVERRGCDLAPIDLSKAAQQDRLLAYIWPDQEDRLTLALQAVEISRTNPPQVDRAEASDWVQRTLTLPKSDGMTTVLIHSVIWGYIPKVSRDTITAHMDLIGAQATKEKSLAWVTFELDEDIKPALRLRLWPDGEDLLLAHAHPHCQTVNWML